MPILNYTTSIKTEKTVGEIQAALGRSGAKQILFEYEGDEVMSISFRLMYRDSMVTFRLPANVDNIYTVLQNDSSVPRKLRTMEQASRVAWRIIKVWLLAQLALVQAEQAEMVQVFLPYAQSETGATLFELMTDTNFKLLTGPKG